MTTLTEIFLREFRQKHDAETAVFLEDGAQRLQTALQRLDADFRCVATEIGMLSNVFSRAKPTNLVLSELLQLRQARNS